MPQATSKRPSLKERKKRVKRRCDTFFRSAKTIAVGTVPINRISISRRPSVWRPAVKFRHEKTALSCYGWLLLSSKSRIEQIQFPSDETANCVLTSKLQFQLSAKDLEKPAPMTQSAFCFTCQRAELRLRKRWQDRSSSRCNRTTDYQSSVICIFILQSPPPWLLSTFHHLMHFLVSPDSTVGLKRSIILSPPVAVSVHSPVNDVSSGAISRPLPAAPNLIRDSCLFGRATRSHPG